MMSVRENMGVSLRLRGTPKREIASAVTLAGEILGVS